MPTSRALVRFAVSLLLAHNLLGCGSPAALDPDAPSTYRATITRTAFGIPHIEAIDLANLGFGEGYAQAEDHLCSVADQIVKARGERARYLGRGDGDAHVISDTAMRALDLHGRASADLEREPAEMLTWYNGYAAGYNLYLAETGRDQVPGWCRGAEWLVPISAQDLAAYLRMVTLVLPRLAGPIASAAPPAAETSAVNRVADSVVAPDSSFDLSDLAPTSYGASNGWALGSEWSTSGGGMLVANPHYPWVGANRFWEKHLRIPGELDVYGVGLLGVPGVAIGFNRDVAWTHTVSAGTRLTLMRLDLVPGDPTRYRYGDTERAMTSRTIAFDVRSPSGTIETVERTVWFSHHGPIVRLPGIGWTNERALAVRDANQDNEEARAHWLAMNRASSLDDLKAAHATHQGMPWVNTIATSADGRAWYADTAATPNLTDDAISAWLERRASDPLTRGLWDRSGLVLLDGSDPRFDWQDDTAARDPGVVPYAALPQLERRDYVWNANDSFWLANAKAPIEGAYSPLHGAQRTQRSLRSRNNELTLDHRSPDRPAGDDRTFDLDELANALLANRSHAAEVLKPELVDRCTTTPTITVDGVRHDLARACSVLAAWNDRYDVDSRGAVLFREWITRYTPADLDGAGALFAIDFDPADPVTTPRGLAPPTGGRDLALENLARAAALLDAESIPLDTSLGEHQFHDKAGRRIPIHGGQGQYEGILNMQINARNTTTLEPMNHPASVEGSRFLTAAGYPVVHGSSFILVLDFRADGPVANAILTYSQSGDPASPHFADQTELFSQKQLRPVIFTPEAIAENAQRTYEVSAPH